MENECQIKVAKMLKLKTLAASNVQDYLEEHSVETEQVYEDAWGLSSVLTNNKIVQTSHINKLQVQQAWKEDFPCILCCTQNSGMHFALLRTTEAQQHVIGRSD